MEPLLEGLSEAAAMIARGDPDLLSAARLSLEVSLSAVVIALLLGVPAGALLAWGRFPGRGALLALANTLMGLPPVVAGLLVVMLLFRAGPLGSLGWLYTPEGMVLAQAIIALPIVVGLSAAAYEGAGGGRARLQLLGLGASHVQAFALLTVEARLPLLAAIMAALGRVFAEVGAVMMVGGNLRGETRVLTTAIVLEARRGNLATALGYAAVLMAIAMAISGLLTWLQQRRPRGEG